MPKKMVAGPTEAGGDFGVAALPTWQAAGLSLAVVVGHVFNGSGALLFALFSVAVIWTLHRLHTHAPQARTTADLIASVPGAAPAGAIRIIQFVAYVLIGAYTAKSIAAMALSWMNGPNMTVPDWSGPAVSVAAVAVAAVLVGALPTRLLAPVATVLAAIGLLVFFYVGLAVIAKVASGTAPITPTMELGATPASAEWGPAALLISLAIAFAVFEIPTTVNARLTSVARPLGLAMALVVLCAAVAWVATNMGSTGEFRYDAVDLFQIAAEMFGDSGGLWLLAATIATGGRRPAGVGVGRDPRHPPARLRQPDAVGRHRDCDGRAGDGDGRRLGRRRGETLGRRGHPVVGRLCRCRSGEFTFGRFQHDSVGSLRADGDSGRSDVFLTGADVGWWPVAIAAVIVVAAAAWAAKIRAGQSGRPNSLMTP